MCNLGFIAWVVRTLFVCQHQRQCTPELPAQLPQVVDECVCVCVFWGGARMLGCSTLFGGAVLICLAPSPPLPPPPLTGRGSVAVPSYHHTHTLSHTHAAVEVMVVQHALYRMLPPSPQFNPGALTSPTLPIPVGRHWRHDPACITHRALQHTHHTLQHTHIHTHTHHTGGC